MYSMNYIGKFISNFRDFYNEINAATLTGAIDVVVIQQPNGSFTCSPFHVRFGKLGVLRSREKVVDIEINSESRQIHMKLGDSGEAFFVEEVQGFNGNCSDTEIPPHLACSPIPNDDDCFPNNRRFNVLSDLPHEQHEKILRDSVMSIEREKWEQMSALPPNERENFLIEHFSDLPLEQREKWLQIASLTSEERDKIFHEYYGTISTVQKQQMISEQYSALKTEDKERLFKENFPELPADQRQRFEEALLTDWKRKDHPYSPKKLNREEIIDNEDEEIEEEEDNDDEDKEKCSRFNVDEEIFDMDIINQDDKLKAPAVANPKSFVAVTSSERIRKISVVKNDFRPIVENLNNDPYEEKEKLVNESVDIHMPLSSSSSSSSAKRNSKDESTADETKIGSNTSKRKRKRKSLLKRKTAQRKISNAMYNTSESCNSDQNKISQGICIPDTEKHHIIDPEAKTVLQNEIIDTAKDDDLNKLNVIHASTDFHFFSDTEVTTKDKGSRPNSPVQSDTEFEVQKITQESKVGEEEKSHGQSWRWGELPSPPHDGSLVAHGLPLNTVDASNPNIETAEARRSMLGGMFSFMKKTSRVRHNPESEGIYLSDLNADELDPEVAALYFPSSHRNPGGGKTGDEEDAESGNGPSLPQSPNSVEGAIGGPKSLDSDFDESTTKHLEPSIEVALSLCGGLGTGEHELTEEAFQRGVLRYEDACADPKIFENPNLVVKVNGKFHSWSTACAIVMTFAAFQRHLPRATLSSLYDGGKRPSDSKATETGATGGGYSSWFSWRRSSQPPKKSPNSSFGKNDEILAETPSELNDSEPLICKDNVPDNKTTVDISDENRNVNDERIIDMTNSLESLTTSQSLVNFSDAIEDKLELALHDLPKDLDPENLSAGNVDFPEVQRSRTGIDIPLSPKKLSAITPPAPVPKRLHYEGSTQNYRKTLRLTSEQIASLNLKEGVNEVVFSVTTAYQGTTRCKCFIYKWRWDDKIVISDIDGTITKSDVLGHILPIVGKDWAQSGVAQLFTKIKNNGYKLLYLSARAIGQARVTREYLKSIKQGDLSLPDGPLLLNPTSLISAFHREVIEKKPEEFKISCLSDIKALFAEGSQPFYAGYGNRINDVWAYRAVGIPTTRIFTINHRGELKHELTQTFQSSYSNMSYIVDHMFPALREDAADEFSNFAYWREPIQELPKLETLDVQN
ncbi:PREDICTED: phosphatidate phosphatase LPIN1 isoform X2 [Ceratosolen solmsi marchali]|uniref:phosphatidate phosphatase n=1 Tax=Ceratosolen solmsi marchali TaxID=326594 RepID=A0AAJ6YJ92_9HYME|nr:PREDICTED: phosphatidate phosphatase LPIN1 isoform X2 [Ceratosolen solmsi marchali]